MKLRFLFVMMILLTSVSQASAQSQGWTDQLYQSGKIYVVTGVLFLILAGILFYLIRLDRKVKQLEKEMEDKA